MRLLGVIAVLILAGCGTDNGPSVPRPGSDLLPAEVLAFDGAGFANEDVVEIGDEPVLWPELAGAWDRGDEPPADTPGMTYLAVATVTGCRAPESVRVTRTGPTMTVEFTGGTEAQTCARAFGPSVLLALRSADVEGVRSVNGLTPAEPTGAGLPTAFVPLGAGLDLEESGQALGLDPLYTELRTSGANNLPEAKAALEARVESDSVGLAFVASGCAETGAVLVPGMPFTTRLTGGDGTTCDAPAYFLVTFEVPAGYLSEGAVPGGR